MADGKRAERMTASALTSREVDFPRWYQEVVAKAELADNGPVRGTMVIRPYGWAIWERIQAGIDTRIKAAGAANAYFPLFIPQDYLRREADHIEGFSPELAVVTYAGGKELHEPIVVRPTSETIVGEYMSKWVQSHRDLPLLLNQWVNVVRWELRPRLFLRTSEFLWQEGHTAHATQADASQYAKNIHLGVYRDFMERELALPVLVGLKTDRERFAGATNTMTAEAMMGDGKALQIATSHELGQNFARAFDITYLGTDEDRHLVWTTSWGASTRIVGGLIMGHGDDAGLRIPPRLAPIQVVVLQIRDDPSLTARVEMIDSDLRAHDVRSTRDTRPAGFGRRVTDWELKGVPLRIEVGPRELAEGKVTVIRRDTGERIVVALNALVETVAALLDDIQVSLFKSASSRLSEWTHEVDTVEDAIEAAKTGFAKLPWRAVGEEGEARLVAESLGVRCIQRKDGSLPEWTDEPDLVCVVARAY